MLAGSLVVTLLIIGVGLPALGILLWAVRNGQFDDPSEAAWQILNDEDLRARRPWKRARSLRGFTCGKRVERFIETRVQD